MTFFARHSKHGNSLMNLAARHFVMGAGIIFPETCSQCLPKKCPWRSLLVRAGLVGCMGRERCWAISIALETRNFRALSLLLGTPSLVSLNPSERRERRHSACVAFGQTALSFLRGQCSAARVWCYDRGTCRVEKSFMMTFLSVIVCSSTLPSHVMLGVSKRIDFVPRS